MGFATFYLSRTNRSGIFNAAVFGGRDQTGRWKIDARYNADELVQRIEAIGKMKDRISLTRRDAMKFLRSGIDKWPEKTLIYLDPPYYVKGRDLHYDYYQHDDHAEVAAFVTGKIKQQSWVVSYDNVKAIRGLYAGYRHLVYGVGYSARDARVGSEVMFFYERLRVPAPVGIMTATAPKGRANAA